MIRIPAIRIPALFGALIVGFLPLSVSSASASPVLTDDESYAADTASRGLNVSATLGDGSSDVSASSRMKYISGDWHGVTLSDAKAFTVDHRHLGGLPAIVSMSIISGGKSDGMISLPVVLQKPDGDVPHQRSFFSSMMSTIASIPLSLPLFGLGLIVISLIARRGKKSAASLT